MDITSSASGWCGCTGPNNSALQSGMSGGPSSSQIRLSDAKILSVLASLGVIPSGIAQEIVPPNS